MNKTDMINWMDDFLDKCLNMNLKEAPKFQIMKYFRDQLLVQNFSTDAANLIACKMELDVSDEFWQDYQDDVKRHLDKFAIVIGRLYDEVDEEFRMDVDLFVDTFASQMTYSLKVD